MLFINIILAIFVGLILHHIMRNPNIIEGLNDDSTEYTAAKVNVELGTLNKDLNNIQDRVKTFKTQMTELSSMKAHMGTNTTIIMGLQEAIAKIETEMDNYDA